MEQQTTEPKQSLPTKKCKKKNCGHEWVPRVPNPRRCPKCLSYDRDKEVNLSLFLIHELYEYEVGIAAKRLVA